MTDDVIVLTDAVVSPARGSVATVRVKVDGDTRTVYLDSVENKTEVLSSACRAMPSAERRDRLDAALAALVLCGQELTRTQERAIYQAMELNHG